MLVIALIAAVWLAVIGVVVAMCVTAARADRAEAGVPVSVDRFPAAVSRPSADVPAPIA